MAVTKSVKKTRVNMDEVNKLVEKYDAINEVDKSKLDLSADEDLSVAIMNLINIEEHLFFSGAKTGKKQYFTILKEVRTLRGELLKRLVKKPEGEVWCISKHLLGTSYRLMEYGTKLLGQGRDDEAKDMFEKAFGVYSLFWGINMGLLDEEGMK